MNIINQNTRLSDIVKHAPTSVTVLNRFGIRLGVGDLTVATASQRQNIDPDFFATILNAFLNEDYFPTHIQPNFSAQTIVDYLEKTNQYYQHLQLPNIERHFGFLISKSPSTNNNLAMMHRFFQEVKQQLLQRIEDDRQNLFPELLAAQAQTTIKADTRIDHNEPDEDSVEDKLNDLISMFVIHLQGDYDQNLALAVLLTIVSLKNDISQNNRIRNRILRPMRDALNNKPA